VPTPIGHGLTSAGVIQAAGESSPAKVFFLFLAGLFPDVDILLGRFPVLRKLGFYHQGITHTFLAAVVFSVAVLAISGDRKLAGLSLLLYFLHILLDLFMVDHNPPIGFRPFYPFWDKLLNFPFIPPTDKSSLGGMVSRGSLRALLWETSFFTYIYITILGVKAWIGRKD